MNKKLLDLVAESNRGSRPFYEQEWQYNCAAWTAEEVENLADAIVNECVNMLVEASAEAEEAGKRANSRLILQLAERMSELFDNEEVAEPVEQ